MHLKYWARWLKLRWHLLGRQDFSWTADYLTRQLPTWEKHLGHLRNQPGLQVLEIGSFEGRSALWFLLNLCGHPQSRLTCIDLFCELYELRFDHNLRRSGCQGRLRKCKGYSQDWLLTFPPESFDLIYIDGSHRAADVLLDGTLSWKLLKSGGLLLFDDYLWRIELPPRLRPQLAIDCFLENLGSRGEVLHRGYQVLVRKVHDDGPAPA